jgi:hypothetical protein
MQITIPVSAGGLIDQITILQLKQAHITDATRRGNVCRELTLLIGVRKAFPALQRRSIRQIERQLLEVNRILWAVEDKLRKLEQRKDFGPQFIAAARRVYRTNDKRAELKRQIDRLTGSLLTEEKCFSARAERGARTPKRSVKN